MAKTLNTRLQLKYDTFENWSTNNPVLLSGEVAIATVPAASGDVKQAPAVLMKVGDGTNKYNDLKFVSGLAANVSSWALAASKPTYTAAEIDGLSNYINNEIKDTNTTYQIVKVSDYSYKLQSKELGGEWADVTDGTITIPKYDDSAVKSDISALQTLVGSTAVATQISTAIAALNLANTYDAKGAAASALTEAKAYTDTLANGAVKTNTTAINAIKDGTTLDSFADVEAELANKDEKGAAAGALAEAKKYADGKDAAIAAAKAAGDNAKTAVDTLSGKVGEVAEGKTVVQMIEEAKTAATYDDTQVKKDIAANKAAIATVTNDYLKSTDKTELQGNIDTVSGKVTTLVGDDADKSVRTIANEELAKQLIPEGANEKMDTLKEIADWIQKHPGDAAAMNTAIGKAQSDADKAQSDVDAVAERVTTAEGTITTLQGASHTHANKALLDTYTQTETDLADAVAKKHSHANAAVLDGITSTKVSNWDAAKTGMDSLTAKVGTVTEGKTVVQMIEEAKTAATYDDTQVKKDIAANKTAISGVSTRVGSLETNAVLDGDTVILNCGTSVIA